MERRLSDGRDHDIDVFVSFEAADDTPIEAGGPGCVALLRDSLQQFAKPRLKRELVISGSDADGVTPDQAALFIGVLSPAYLDSIERNVEAETFAIGAQDGGDGRRMFSVLRSPVDRAQMLDTLRDVRTLGLTDEEGNLTRALVIRAAAALAKDLCAPLTGQPSSAAPESRPSATEESPPAAAEAAPTTAAEPARPTAAEEPTPATSPEPGQAVEPEPEPAPAPEAAPPAAAPAMRSGGTGPAARSNGARTVFLAHTDPGMRRLREQMRAELEDRGFRVVPEGPARSEVDEILAGAESALEAAEISVHILGDDYDDAAHLECDLAGERAGGGKLRRMVWLASEDEPRDPRQRRLFEAIESASGATEPLRRTSLEGFKEAVLAALVAADRKVGGARVPLSAGEAPGQYRYVYLLFDQSDLKRTDRLRRLLQKKDCVVWTPLFEGSAEEIDRQHRTYLQDCDASLVVYGEAPERWWKGLATDWLHLFRVMRRERPLPRGYYFLEPFNEEKLGFKEPGTVVIRAGERFSEDDLMPFFKTLTGAEPEQG